MAGIELKREEMLAKGLSTPEQSFKKIEAEFEVLEKWVRGATSTPKGVTENILAGVDAMRTRLNLMKSNIGRILGVGFQSNTDPVMPPELRD